MAVSVTHTRLEWAVIVNDVAARYGPAAAYRLQRTVDDKRHTLRRSRAGRPSRPRSACTSPPSR